MNKPNIRTFQMIAPLLVQKYERYLPTAFDESLSLLEKVNKVIEYMNQVGELSHTVVNQWNEVMEWVMNDGLSADVNRRLDEMTEDGTLDTIINHNIFNELNQDIQNVKTGFQTFKGEVSADMDNFNTEVNQNINSFKGTVNQDLSGMRSDVQEFSVNINASKNSRGAIHSKNPNPTFVITDDDVRNELYDLLFPYCQTKGIPFSAGVISSRVGVNSNTITYAQFKEMQSKGVDFINHSHTHVHFDGLSDAQIETEVRECEKWLRKEGIYTRHLIYPYGRYEHRMRRILEKYVDSALIYGSQVFRPDIHIMDSFQVRRTTLETDMSVIKARIDLAAEGRGLFILNTHAHYPDFSIERLDEVVQYAQQKGLEFSTYTRAYERFSNILELRRNDVLITGISCTGYTENIKDFEHIHPSDYRPITDVTVNSTPDSFPAMKTTSITFTSARATTAGMPSAGTLTTHRKHNDDYTFQEFMPIRSTQPVRRWWNTTTQQWSAFA